MNVLAPIALCFVMYVAIFIIFAVLVPSLKIRHELWASFLGLLAVLPTAFTEYVVLSLPIFTAHTFFTVLITALVFNGLIEESLKMIFMLLLPYKKLKLPAFFACSVLCGLVFGSFESVIYMLVYLQKISSGGIGVVYKLILIRMFTAVIIHTFCAGLSGLYIWSFRKKASNITSFIFAVLFHGLYNFFAGNSGLLYWFIIPVILFAIVECRIRYLVVSEKKTRTKKAKSI
ncbi:PrsW family intramembrane metalloprotease [Treponema parvum]|uniref:PrsW family intramembrane metalloprotease n=1 Tax=Treponema parvum TaxID=138851 RepID=A0A975F2V5_9SPIR|nr:PrsW family glutamic-type intramembrane protease [Treponema parvum]QTQ13089.1 PrsW family intramembrane metalloprotease [Treponema parvum]QTQ15331.1 PrsW family intramembrane metalloprotease [Treponema parvum]